MDEHERIRKMIPLAASDDLSQDDFRQVEKHVATCASCRRAGEDIAALGDALRALPTPQPSEELVARVCRMAETRLVPRPAPGNGATFLAPLVAASWMAALATWPLLRTVGGWIFGGWNVPGGIIGNTLAAYSVLGMILACASAFAVEMRARELGRTK